MTKQKGLQQPRWMLLALAVLVVEVILFIQVDAFLFQDGAHYALKLIAEQRPFLVLGRVLAPLLQSLPFAVSLLLGKQSLLPLLSTTYVLARYLPLFVCLFLLPRDRPSLGFLLLLGLYVPTWFAFSFVSELVISVGILWASVLLLFSFYWRAGDLPSKEGSSLVGKAGEKWWIHCAFYGGVLLVCLSHSMAALLAFVLMAVLAFSYRGGQLFAPLLAGSFIALLGGILRFCLSFGHDSETTGSKARLYDYLISGSSVYWIVLVVLFGCLLLWSLLVLRPSLFSSSFPGALAGRVLLVVVGVLSLLALRQAMSYFALKVPILYFFSIACLIVVCWSLVPPAVPLPGVANLSLLRKEGDSVFQAACVLLLCSGLVIALVKSTAWSMATDFPRLSEERALGVCIPKSVYQQHHPPKWPFAMTDNWALPALSFLKGGEGSWFISTQNCDDYNLNREIRYAWNPGGPGISLARLKANRP